MSTVPDWKDTICIPLTAADIIARAAKPGPAIITTQGEPAKKPEGNEPIGCQGPHCAWFTPITDEHGNMINGRCAIAMIPTAVHMAAARISAN